MAEMRNPEFALSSDPICFFFSLLISLFSLGFYIFIAVTQLASRDDLVQDSAYSWSTFPSLLTQFSGTIIGVIAPIIRCFTVVKCIIWACESSIGGKEAVGWIGRQLYVGGEKCISRENNHGEILGWFSNKAKQILDGEPVHNVSWGFIVMNLMYCIAQSIIMVTTQEEEAVIPEVQLFTLLSRMIADILLASVTEPMGG